MIDIENCMMWLRNAEALVSVPLIVIGLALMLGGWRFGMVCVAVTYAAAAGLVNYAIFAEQPAVLLLACASAVVAGGFSLVIRRWAIPVLGGAIGAGLALQVLWSLGLRDWPLWIAGIAALVSLTALCHAHIRHVLITITSFEGAVLLLAGLVPILAASPGLFRFFQGLSRTSDIFIPFLLMVPTLTGVFLQMADARNKDSGMTQA